MLVKSKQAEQELEAGKSKNFDEQSVDTEKKVEQFIFNMLINVFLLGYEYIIELIKIEI